MISDLTKAGLTAATAGVSSQLIVMAQEYNGKADAVEAVSKALPPVAVIVALAVCMLAFPPAVLAQPQSVGELLVGKAAFGDWRTDAPMVRRKITDLPAPYATRPASNPPRVIGKPVSATPQVPPGFQVELFASNLHDPRTIRVAPNGDIFIAESEPGRIRVIRAADGATKPSSNDVFASGLDQPFGIAFYPPGSDPQWIYVANTGSVVRSTLGYARQDAGLSARPKRASCSCGSGSEIPGPARLRSLLVGPVHDNKKRAKHRAVA
jgi:glucose/arabinose dehydrogenase